MIAQKRSLKKITMATSVVAMTVGLITAISLDASADTGGPGEGRSCVNQVSQNWGHCNSRFDMNSGVWYRCSAPQQGQTLDCNGTNP